MTALDRYLVQADFEGVVNTTFRLGVAADQEFEMTLVEVSPQPSTSPDWEMFSLLFEIEGTPAFAHDTYPVTHASLGDFALFVGPVRTASGELLYESVFNHPKQDPRSRDT